MRYSLFPFQRFSNTTFDGGLPDIRDVLQSRPCVQTSKNVTTLQLLDHVVDCLQNVPWKMAIDHCEEDQGRLHLAVVATNLGRDLSTTRSKRDSTCSTVRQARWSHWHAVGSIA